jgi:hypothetical protein
MYRSLSIVAMGPSRISYEQDFESNGQVMPTTEVWMVNSCCYWYGPRMFTHGIALDAFDRDEVMDGGKWKQYVENITDCGKPVIADKKYDRWPNVERYPIEDVVSDIWPDAKCIDDIVPDLENTISFATALAITRKFDEIHLYGCDFRLRDRPQLLYERADKLEKIKPWWFVFHDRDIVRGRRDQEPGEACTMFLLGVAQQRRIKIVIPPGSTLCNMDRSRYVYGYQDAPDVFKEKSDE